MKNDEANNAIRNALNAAAIVAHERRAAARRVKNRDAIETAEAMCKHIDAALGCVRHLDMSEPITFKTMDELARDA